MFLFCFEVPSKIYFNFNIFCEKIDLEEKVWDTGEWNLSNASTFNYISLTKRKADQSLWTLRKEQIAIKGAYQMGINSELTAGVNIINKIYP